jgi:ABC-2 type transport system permease protein
MLVQVLQFVFLIAVAVALGWRPDEARWGLALAGVLAGTAAFAGIGLLLAGRLRGEVNLAAQNGLFILLLLLGGMVIPLDELPSWLASLASWLPAASLSDVLRASLSGSEADVASTWSWFRLVAWAVAAPAAASRLFRWW